MSTSPPNTESRLPVIDQDSEDRSLTELVETLDEVLTEELTYSTFYTIQHITNEISERTIDLSEKVEGIIPSIVNTYRFLEGYSPTGAEQIFDIREHIQNSKLHLLEFLQDSIGELYLNHSEEILPIARRGLESDTQDIRLMALRIVMVVLERSSDIDSVVDSDTIRSAVGASLSVLKSQSLRENIELPQDWDTPEYKGRRAAAVCLFILFSERKIPADHRDQFVGLGDIGYGKDWVVAVLVEVMLRKLDPDRSDTISEEMITDASEVLANDSIHPNHREFAAIGLGYVVAYGPNSDLATQALDSLRATISSSEMESKSKEAAAIGIRTVVHNSDREPRIIQRADIIDLKNLIFGPGNKNLQKVAIDVLGEIIKYDPDKEYRYLCLNVLAAAIFPPKKQVDDGTIVNDSKRAVSVCKDVYTWVRCDEMKEHTEHLIKISLFNDELTSTLRRNSNFIRSILIENDANLQQAEIASVVGTMIDTDVNISTRIQALDEIDRRLDSDMEEETLQKIMNELMDLLHSLASTINSANRGDSSVHVQEGPEASRLVDQRQDRSEQFLRYLNAHDTVETAEKNSDIGADPAVTAPGEFIYSDLSTDDSIILETVTVEVLHSNISLISESEFIIDDMRLNRLLGLVVNMEIPEMMRQTATQILSTVFLRRHEINGGFVQQPSDVFTMADTRVLTHVASDPNEELGIRIYCLELIPNLLRDIGSPEFHSWVSNEIISNWIETEDVAGALFIFMKGMIQNTHSPLVQGRILVAVSRYLNAAPSNSAKAAGASAVMVEILEHNESSRMREELIGGMIDSVLNRDELEWGQNLNTVLTLTKMLHKLDFETVSQSTLEGVISICYADEIPHDNHPLWIRREGSKAVVEILQTIDTPEPFEEWVPELFERFTTAENKFVEINMVQSIRILSEEGIGLQFLEEKHDAIHEMIQKGSYSQTVRLELVSVLTYLD